MRTIVLLAKRHVQQASRPREALSSVSQVPTGNKSRHLGTLRAGDGSTWFVAGRILHIARPLAGDDLLVGRRDAAQQIGMQDNLAAMPG
jgi:hypothetical protein